jgi:hypothetical protein
MANVVQRGGYHNLARFVDREGKSRLSMEKVVKQMQGQFSEDDWYYLRKIHKKEHNFFLEKGGQRGSSGGGWLSHKTKSTVKS